MPIEVKQVLHNRRQKIDCLL